MPLPVDCPKSPANNWINILRQCFEKEEEVQVCVRLIRGKTWVQVPALEMPAGAFPMKRPFESGSDPDKTKG